MKEVPLLIFDGDCGFCTRSVNFIRRIARNAPPAQEYYNTDISLYGLTVDDCLESVKYVNRNGEVLHAGEAFLSWVVDAGGVVSIPARVARIRLLAPIREFIYRKIAGNRYRLPGAAGSCALNLSEQDDQSENNEQ